MPYTNKPKKQYSNKSKSLVKDNNDLVKNLEEGQFKKPINKVGRTLLVKSGSSTLTDSSVDNLALKGLDKIAKTKSSSSYFLTLDTVDNAESAFTTLTQQGYNVKYSYYRVFFTINGLTNSSDYTDVRTKLDNLVKETTGAPFLFCKLYRKDDKYLGCGDFTIDTMEGMNLLLSKEGESNLFTLKDSDLSGVFYRYNGNKDKSEKTQASSNS